MRFQTIFRAAGRKCVSALWVLIAFGSTTFGQVRLVENEQDEGQDAFKIETPTATYYYQTEAGAFSSILDKDGHDWVSFNRSAGPRGMYRGLPNLVHPDNYFHPGYKNCRSEVVLNSRRRVTIASASLDGKWKCTWDIRPTHATLTVTHTGGRPYWLLYEGTPGGEFSESDDYYFLADGRQHPCSEPMEQRKLPAPEWVCFGDKNLNRVFFIVHHEADDAPDQYYPMDGMTVWGFGRNYRCCEKFMQKTPNTFSIGFIESTEAAFVRKRLRRYKATKEQSSKGTK